MACAEHWKRSSRLRSREAKQSVPSRTIHRPPLELQLLGDVDAIAVGTGENKAAQAVVGVAEPFDDADSVLDEVIV